MDPRLAARQGGAMRNWILAAAAACGIASLGCSLELQGDRAAPSVPLQGLWATPELLEGANGAVLHVEMPGGEDRPYRFTLLELHFREMTFSGQRIYFHRREGVADSSAEELLLEQRRFTAGFYQQDEAGPWRAAALQPISVERSFENSSTPDLLRIAESGARLQGDSFEFIRFSGVQAEMAVCGVIRSEGAAHFGVCLDRSAAVQGAARDLYKDGVKLGRGKISAMRDVFVDLESAAAPVGSFAVAVGWRPGRPAARVLTREEALRRLQRGETLSREEMIRALGSDQPPRR